jgi:hypothetical protein
MIIPTVTGCTKPQIEAGAGQQVVYVPPAPTIEKREESDESEC